MSAEAASTAASSSGKRHHRAEEGIARAGEGAAPPQKRYFRQRAHINPLNVADGFEYPLAPTRMRWRAHYPAHFSVNDASGCEAASTGARVTVADIGCGFGGLLAGLSPVLPDSLLLGLEIRAKVAEYVRLRILAARRGAAVPSLTGASEVAEAAPAIKPVPEPAPAADEPVAASALTAMVTAASTAEDMEAAAAAAAETSTCHNASVIKTNAMKLLPRYFARAQLSKLFFCFPDPHFKRANVRRRVINVSLLAEYAYVLREGGLLYTITDVRDLHNWMVANCEAHPAFIRVPDAELVDDPCVPVMRACTEEGQKVARLHGSKFVAVFRRATRAEADAKASAELFSASRDFFDRPALDYEHRRAKNRAEYAL